MRIWSISCWRAYCCSSPSDKDGRGAAKISEMLVACEAELRSAPAHLYKGISCVDVEKSVAKHIQA
eukprot:7923690-Karenia_brevis.AAC.1